MAGPLDGLRIIEIASIGPGPFCAMMLADHGAEVIRVDRIDDMPTTATPDILLRSRRSIAIDLKRDEGIAVVRDLCRSADAVIEGFRPGVMERLGLGPQILLADNPRLVYGRVTGWGQDGPLAGNAGHDINYIALAGVLHTLGSTDGPPLPPTNVIGDFGGGGMMLAFGVLSALLSARQTGKGQVIDCAMTEGSALLMSMIWSFRASGFWHEERGSNVLDGGAHFYNTYETADAKFIAIGAIEPQFYAELRRRIGLEDQADFDVQMDRSGWTSLRDKLAVLFKSKTRDEWVAILQQSDACFTPVLSMAEAPLHAHNRARGSFIELDGVTQPAPAPRYSATPTALPRTRPAIGADTCQILHELGYPAQQVAELQHDQVVRQIYD